MRAIGGRRLSMGCFEDQEAVRFVLSGDSF